LTGPGFTSSPRFPEGTRSERYEKEDVLEVFGITTGADSPAGELALAEMDGAGEEAAFGGVPELTRINAIITVAAATMLTIIVPKSVRPRCIGPPTPSCLNLGN
jgi:hypothetical protein